MHVDGRCLCGAITYEAEIDPKKVFVCNCTDCQTQSGAFRVATPVPADAFQLKTGEPRLYTKVAESGAKRHLAFCAACGTSLYGAAADDPNSTRSLRVGTLNQRAELAPVGRLWCRSALPWLDGLAELPGIDTQPSLPKRSA
jgi:hypothetical protein